MTVTALPLTPSDRASWGRAVPAMNAVVATAAALAVDLNGYAVAYAYLAQLSAAAAAGSTFVTENDLIAASDRAAYYENILPGSFEAHDRATNALASI